MVQGLHITSEFWDFIEANVPNYHQREDVLRQAKFQDVIDGRQSAVPGITQQEAVLLRDRILLRLYHEAIDNFTLNLPVSISGESDLRNYAETIADIAYEAGARGFHPTNNSRDISGMLIAWANEFYRQHQHTDWSNEEYLDKIGEFTERKLGTSFCEDNPDKECSIAFLNRDTLRCHGYPTDNISDDDLQKLAGLMGDSYCDSSQFSHDLHTACQGFGLKQHA